MVDDVGESNPGRLHFGLILALTINGLAVSHYPEMVRVSNIAESYGFDSIWLCDHFLTTSPEDYVQDAGITPAGAQKAIAGTPPTSMALLEGWTALTALARDTTRIRLGTSVLCNSYRHPAVLAKMAATLDVISEGRLELGLGAGWFQREFDCDPPPLQQPHPPLWVGGEGLRVQRMAARSAQGINIRWWSPEKVRDRTQYLAESCAAVGRDPATLRLSVTTLLAPTDSAEQEEQVRREFASIPESGLIVGSPQKCIERINEYRESGIDTFLFTIPYVASSDYIHTTGERVFGTFNA